MAQSSILSDGNGIDDLGDTRTGTNDGYELGHRRLVPHHIPVVSFGPGVICGVAASEPLGGPRWVNLVDLSCADCAILVLPVPYQPRLRNIDIVVRTVSAMQR